MLPTLRIPVFVVSVLYVLGSSQAAAEQGPIPTSHSAVSGENATAQGFVTQPQKQIPLVETTVAWSAVSDSTVAALNSLLTDRGGTPLTVASSRGFSVSVTGNRNNWFGVTLEAGGSFLKQIAPGFEDLGNAYEGQQWTVLAGPKFTSRNPGLWEPYAAILAGVAYVSYEMPIVSVNGSEWEFVLQPGAGVDLMLTDRVSVRFGFDGRLLSGRAFGGPTAGEFRFTLGTTFRSRFR